MKALQLVGTRRIALDDVPAPEIMGEHDILLRVKAVSICGTDLHYYRGEPAGNPPLAYPFIMGHEFAGRVEAVGQAVTTLRVGDRVAVDPAVSCGVCEFCLSGNPNICPHVRFTGSPTVPGAFQDLLVHPAHTAFKLPDNLSYAHGAILEPLGVALHAVNLGKLRVADTVAVVGCGPIGLLIIQLARLSGAQDVFASEILDYRVQMAAHAGASMVVNASVHDPVAAILEATHGRGVDVVFEVAGDITTPDQASRVCKPGGMVVIVGICAEDSMPFQAGPSRRKGLTIKVARRMKHVYERTIPLAARHMVDLDSFLTHSVPWERGDEAFAMLADYQDEAGKVVLLNE